MDESFGLAIQEHLELRARNRLLEAEMPLDRYRTESVSNHSLFKSEEAAVLEDTLEWSFPDEVRPEGQREPLLEPVEELWSVSPAFDWGD